MQNITKFEKRNDTNVVTDREASDEACLISGTLCALTYTLVASGILWGLRQLYWSLSIVVYLQ